LWLKFKIDLNNKRGGIEYESDNEKRFREKVMTNAKRYDLQWKINGEVNNKLFRF
jgi:Holliday junction resolvase RusA-like endonuclease